MRALALAGVLVLTGCRADDDGGGVGADLPAVELPALDDAGEPLALGDLTGPAVVNLWATWCGPCRAELPAFQRAAEDHPDVRFVGVDIGEEAPEALAFLDEIDIDTAIFEQYGDPESALTDALEVANLPVTVLVDGEGRMADVHLGPMTLDELTSAIADL